MITSKLLGVMGNVNALVVSSKLIIRNALPQLPLLIPRRFKGFKSYNFHDTDGWISKRIGNREVVGYGINGEPEYVDRWDYPFPSIRYRRPTAQIQALREKEKGDWRLLTKNEKREIYRANFCQTFSEFQAPTGDWMCIVGVSFILVSIGIWLFILEKLYVYNQAPMPASFAVESQMAQLCRILTIRNNPMTGLSSRWDYENKKWKNKPWYIPWNDPFGGVECEEDRFE